VAPPASWKNIMVLLCGQGVGQFWIKIKGEPSISGHESYIVDSLDYILVAASMGLTRSTDIVGPWSYCFQ